MSRRLLVVEDRFLIKGRGLIVCPGIELGAEPIRVGDLVELRRPDGTSLRWRIGGVEIAMGAPPDRRAPLMLLQDLGKEDLPVGTEIWST